MHEVTGTCIKVIVLKMGNRRLILWRLHLVGFDSQMYKVRGQASTFLGS